MNASASVRPPADQTLVSVVLPLFNESAVLPRLHELVSRSLDACGVRGEIIFVNDGSTDGGDRILDRLAARDERLRVLHLSRNFGHQAAVQAGLSHARGDCVLVMDSDLQDDPACLASMLREWRDGYDVVYAVRHKRKEHPLKRAMFYVFYRVLNMVSGTPLPMDAGNFGLIDRQVARCIASLPEADRYFSGLRGWVGFRQTGVPVERMARHDEKPRVSLYGLFRLAKTALFSFSTVPLGMFYGIAAVSMLVCLAFCGYTLFFKLFTDKAVLGWTSTVIVGSFFGALNALGIGVLGEYVVRIYDQVRGRPKFIVARETSRLTAAADEDANAGEEATAVIHESAGDATPAAR